MVGANKVLRRFVRVAPVTELRVRRERGEELTGRDAQPLGTAQIAEVDLAKRVATIMANAARRVVAEEHLFRIVDAIDPIHRDEVALSFWKNNQLRPARSNFAAGGGVLVAAS